MKHYAVNTQSFNSALCLFISIVMNNFQHGDVLSSFYDITVGDILTVNVE